MSWESIDSALMQAFNALNLGLPVAMPNTEFTPPVDGPWLAIFNLPASTSPLTMGDNGEDVDLGVFQIDINVPTNTGWAVLNQHAETLRGSFKAGTRYTYNGQSVRVRSCSRGGERQTKAYGAIFATVSISVNWQAFTQR